MTASEARSAAASFVRSIKGRLDLASLPQLAERDGAAAAAELDRVATDASEFLASPGAQLLSDAQMRNLQRMRSTAERRAVAARKGKR
jgi:hypothetical protein